MSHPVLLLLLLLGSSSANSSSSSSSSRGPHDELLQSFLHDLDVNQDANDIEADAESDFTVELFYKPGPQIDTDLVKPLNSPTKIKPESGEPVSRLWGVPDTTATIATLFSMAVPKDAFSGDVLHYQLKGVPSWLHWDGHRHVLEGVARPADRGHHYITIKAVGTDGTKAKDVFSVDVTEMSSMEISRAAGCSNKVDLTLASVVIDKSVVAMDAKTRVRTLRAASKFLGSKKLSLTSVVQDLDPLADDSAIMTGPGSSSHSGHGEMSQIQWVVGCGGEVSASQQDTVDRLEATAKDRSLEKAIDVPVLGWTVVQVHAKTRRVRRALDYSGDDYNYNYDNLDYDNLEYEYGDYVEGDDYDGTYDDEYEEDYEPETRVVPSLASPVFPDAPSATVYPAREPRPEYGSMRPVPLATPIFVPVKPTRVVTIEASPTVAQPSVYSTYYPDLEGSITTQPIDTIEATVPLSTSTVAEISPTSVIHKPHRVSPPSVVTETGVRNFSPEINERIPKLAWTAGHVYRMVIPEKTFSDFEDGNTRDLKLVFKNFDGDNVGISSWIQFDPNNQEIYALPLEENIGHWTFYLEAMDSEGKSKIDTIHINVQQAREARNYNHRITATFKLDKKADFELVYQLDWQVKAVEKIAGLYGDETTENINVRFINNNPHQITWTNISLVDSRSQSCPEDELEDLVQVLVKDNVDMEPNSKAKKAFEPEFVIKDVDVDYLVSCVDYIKVKSHSPFESAPIAPWNNKPDFRNPIDYLNATQGHLFIFKVESDTCYDTEDGDSIRLNMRLLTNAPSVPPPNNWLQFDQNNKEFYGIPLENDVGSKSYNLECVDSGGKKAIDALIVNVRGRDTSKQPPVEFQIRIQHINYDHFMSDSLKKKQLIEKIAEAFGDSNTQHVVVKSLRPGSVFVTWHNSSLPSEPCPNDEIRALREKMLDHNGKLLPSFVAAFHPFNVSRGEVLAAGKCLGEDTPTHIEKPVHMAVPAEDAIQDKEENDYLLNFIIPAIIIACMLLLAAIIACCLYRRRRYGKMTMTDDRTFVSKGIPIIFAEELDDRPDPAKSPIIMKDEKPPLPPPEYQRGSSPAASTPPTGERRRPHSGDHMGVDDSPYQPPPPFTATNGASRHQRPNMPPTYRKPPTYVPP